NQVDATYRADLRELNELNYASFHAVAAQRGNLFLGQAAEQAAQLGGGGEQHRGLAFDHREVGGLVHVGVADVEQLQHLAFGDGVGGVGEDAHHAHVVKLHHQLERARVEEVTHKHAGGVAPQRI